MKKMTRGILRPLLATLCSVSVAFGFVSLPALAEGVDVVAATPDVEVHVDLGTTPVTDAFLTDLRAALVKLGIDSTKVRISLTNTEEVNASDATQWDVYDHLGDWNERAASIQSGYTDAAGEYHAYDRNTDHYYYPNMDPGNDGDMKNDPHIIPSADGATLYFYGYGSPGFNDFLLSKTDVSADKKILFTIDENSATYHSLYGSGFLFDAAVAGGTLSGYAVLVRESDIVLVRIDAADVSAFHESKNASVLTDIPGVTVVETFVKPDTKVHHFTVDVVGQKVSVRDNNAYLSSKPVSPLSEEGMKTFYAGLGNGKSMDSFWWSAADKSFVVSGYRTVAVTVTDAEYAAAGNNIYDAIVAKGHLSGWYAYDYDPDTGTYTVQISEYDSYPWYLVDAGTTIGSYDDAANYLAGKGIAYTYAYDYKYDATLGRYTVCAYAPYDFTKNPIMDAEIAAYADKGIDISKYNESDLQGTNIVWYYVDGDGNSRTATFPVKDIVPGFTIKTSQDYSLPATYGNRFGPICAYASHGCSDLTSVTFSDLQMNIVTTQTDSLPELASSQTYAADAKKFFIHAEGQKLDGLDTAALGAVFETAGVAYIGIGSDTSATQQAAIANAAGAGTTVLASAATYVDEVAAYIYGIVKAKIIENLLATYPVDAETTFTGGSASSDGLSSSVDILDDLLSGDTVQLKLNLATTSLDDVPAADKDLVEAYLGGLTKGADFGCLVLDIDLIKILTNAEGTTETPVTQTLKPVRISPSPSPAQNASDNPSTGDAPQTAALLVVAFGLIALGVTFTRRKRTREE